jgi:hypothetical protein
VSVKPITPAEAAKSRVRTRAARRTAIPDEVIEAFNELITEKLSGSTANVLQKDVVARILLKSCSGSDLDEKMWRQAIYDNGWLDVEPIFEKAGWTVRYDKPCYGGDNYEPYFEFKKSRTR